ncbi:MAG TPA: 50S ribosomal protein L17 [Polyangia bacterium]|jgi:large subunit ribosomal protein L17|nr:50S ribosomal protein L17 [Polyangia bacterium]
MRHRRAGVHLSRPAAHRKALFSNLVAALLTNERIQTTDAKAKETRRLTERTITWARRVGDILVKKPDRRTTEESARVVHAIRMARRIVRDRSAVTKLFDDIAPRFMDRRGGYTRILKIGQRPGDAAHMSLLELVGSEGPKKDAAAEPAKGAPAAKADKKTTAKAKATEAPAAKSKKASAAKAEGGEKAAKPAAKKKAKAEE